MVSRTGEPDWAALYQKHRDAMYRIAARVLREAGLAESAEDAVMDAMTSLMNSPPTETVRNWEAVLVTAAKRKALDLLRSAAIQHRGPQLDETHDTNDRTSVDIAEDSATRVFVVPPITGLSTTYFVRLALNDPNGNLVSSNFYWLSAQHIRASRSVEHNPDIQVDGWTLPPAAR